MRRGPFQIVVPGNPPRKDAWTKNIPGKGHRGRALTEGSKAWIAKLARIWRSSGEDMITWAEWRLTLTIYVQLTRTIESEKFPYRDVDSSVSCVMDAMQKSGVLDDDVRISQVVLMRGHDPTKLRTVVLLEQLGPDDYE